MDIKKIVDEMVDKIKENPAMLAQFREDPIPVLEELMGVDLPDDQVRQVAELIKAKLDLEKVGSLLGGLGGLFGK